ncbi:recombinase family protein [Lysinibacillus capsici]|uniref:recombinase family protein n=1 Tax=Lysinibacillus capsici TaxID=2115968 RepID=UPI00325FDDE9
MPILDTRKYKELAGGVGQLVSDLVLTLLSWIVEEERNRIKKAQSEGIAIAKERGAFKGSLEAEAKGKDRLIYNVVVQLLKQNESVVNIHRETGLAMNTIYSIKRQLKID